MTPDGGFVERGALITIGDSDEQGFVGFRGEAYLPDLPERAIIEVRTHDKGCTVQVDRTITSDPQPRIGPLICALQTISGQ
jgi:outer membrane usher protein FimD/PapC